MIDTGSAFDELLARLQGEPRLGLDTEADSLHCYFEKLCLVQIAVPGLNALIDPLAGFPLHALFDFCRGREVVLHGADYDLRLLRRAGLCEVGALFDTMLAARLAGLREFSLAALLKRWFGLEMHKSSQKANWALRPLPERMRAYALDDVRYLLELRDILAAELEKLGRTAWAAQSCARLLETTRESRVRDEENLWRISGAGLLRGRQAAVLRELWRWRDAEARQTDRPPFHILQNRDLIEAACQFADGQVVVPRHLRGPRLDRFLAAAQKALALPESEWPAPPARHRIKPKPGHEARATALRKKRDTAAAQLGLDPSLLCPRAVLETLADHPDQATTLLLPWQRELLAL